MNTLPRNSGLVFFVAAVASAMLATTSAWSFEGLKVSADGGYSLVVPRTMDFPTAISGAAARARLGYGFNHTWGVEFGAGLSWYQRYIPYDKSKVTGDDGTESTEWVEGTPVENFRIQDLSLMLVYAVDVLRVIPTLALGVSSARILETKADTQTIGHDLAIRFEVSLDVVLNKFFSLGLQYGLDSYLLEASAAASRNNILLRATFTWDVRNFGRGENNR